MARVVLAMSGGVDSSVAAGLLLQQGHEVLGLFMRHGQGLEEGAACPTAGRKQTTKDLSHNRPSQAERPSRTELPTGLGTGPKQGCCSAADAADARRVADRLGIAFYALNFQAEFDRVIAYFMAEYLAGRTPNPCVVCNTWLKFGRLFEYADSVQARYVATGHYARIVQRAGEYALCQGVDRQKDQSYSLFGIRRDRLSRLLFPVGEYSKDGIRRLAADLGLRVADKPDSQEICFVPERDHAAFIRQRGGADTSGEIVTTEGQVIGRHPGLEHFTVGQRKGLKIALGEPRYVVRLEPQTRRVVLGHYQDLARRELTASGANWLIDEPHEPRSCQVMVRYRSRLLPARVESLDEGRFRVRFDEPCHGVAPGQAVVCFDGDRVLCGAWIDS